MPSVNDFGSTTHSPLSPALKPNRASRWPQPVPDQGSSALPEGVALASAPAFRRRPARTLRLSWPTAGTQHLQSPVSLFSLGQEQGQRGVPGSRTAGLPARG